MTLKTGNDDEKWKRTRKRMKPDHVSYTPFLIFLFGLYFIINQSIKNKSLASLKSVEKRKEKLW